MQFKPKTEKEIAEENLWPLDFYQVEVVGAEDSVSRASNNEMIALELKAYNDSGQFIFVKDYLLEKLAFKLRHAAEAFGLLTEYGSGVLQASDFYDETKPVKRATAKIGIQKDKAGKYPDKNVIMDYVVEDPTKSEKKTSEPLVDDEIPF
jgi:hypothetical protein